VSYVHRLRMFADDAIHRSLRFRLREPHAHEPARRLFHRLPRSRLRHGIHDALRLVLATVNALRDVLLSEDLLRVHPVVRAASNTQIDGIVRASVGAWRHVVELEQGLAVAAAPLCVDIGTLLAVTREDLATHRGRDMTRLRPTHCSLRMRRPSEALLLEIRDEQRERSLQDLRRVPVRNPMARELLRALQVVVGRLAQRRL
jgi:hypothetical protein